MIIQKSNVNLSGSSFMISEKKTTETFKMWSDSKAQEVELNNRTKNKFLTLQLDKLELSEEAKDMQSKPVDGEYFELSLSEEDKQKIELIKRLFEELTGKEFKFYGIEKIKVKDPSSDLKYDKNVPNVNNPARQGWGLQYDFHEINIERQSMDFKADGYIKTADGREINFSLDMSMSREQISEKSIRFRAGDAAIDPLFINLNGSVPEFSNERVEFDINNDGSLEKIPEIKSSGGYLALDLNNDGIVNNGSELFGPNTGNGFTELSVYDADNNGWIDENDPVFDKLQIWMKDEEGNDKLYAVSEKGIGAIYLGNVDTKFSIKDDMDSLLGQIRKTGIYLNENGSAGTIQHIDVSV